MSELQESIHASVEKQRLFFRSGQTLAVSWRIEQLKKLKSAIIKNEKRLTDALSQDLSRSESESFLCDIGPSIMEINEMIAGLRRWARPESHFSGVACFPSVITKVHKMPYGVCLIISPYNFPVLLSVGALAAAIAGGNTAVIKASSKSPECTKVLQSIISETFSQDYITVIGGGHDAADFCLAERFDKIFYTGSPKVAHHIMEAAAKNLTPLALELGGETGNWCIVRADADLKDAARKIAFFKLCNSGQICININQVAVAREVADQFVGELKNAFIAQIGENAVDHPEYPRLITREAYEKCVRIAERYKDRIVFGGAGNPDTLKYNPTVIYPVTPEDEITQHELFCPLLPIVPFEDGKIDDLLDMIAAREHGLALYVFTKDMAWANRVMRTQQYGGGCINEVCLHLMVKGVPFNGTGHSGMGAYHGKWGFMEFTHPTTVLIGSPHFNLSLREHPYEGKPFKMKLLRLFER